MNLIDERSTQKFSDLDYGDCFSHNNSFYIKSHNLEYNTVCIGVRLNDGKVVKFDPSTYVVPVKIDGIIKE